MTHNGFIYYFSIKREAGHPFVFTVELPVRRGLSPLYTEHLGVKKEAIHDGNDPAPVPGSWMAQSVVQESVLAPETLGPCSY